MSDVQKGVFVGVAIGLWIALIVVTYTGSCG